MDSNIINELIYVFNFSNSRDELFDAFSTAVSNKIESLELYQSLLWNPALSKDEIILYASKISSLFPSFSYEIFLLTAEIFEFYACCWDDYLTAMLYYKRAISIKPHDETAYLKLIKLYNKDLQIPPLEEILKTVLEGTEIVKCKSKLYYGLAAMYDKLENTFMKKKYIQMGDSASICE
jgi:tetratricopeptide (TPR) repeat protein